MAAFREFKGGEEFVEELKLDEAHKVVHVFLEEPSPPEPGPPVDEVGLSEAVREALRKRGLHRLYKFQVEALEKIGSGKNTVIVAGTGAGKTEAFLLPILEDVVENPFRGVRAVLVYPTKALARDQLSRVNSLVSNVFGARALAFDGDTREREREAIYAMPPPILATNPDMLHYGLMRSPRFRELVSTAKYVVLDDMHVYGGVFGAHVAYVLRRLRRVLREEAVFVGATATIGNPKEFASALLGGDVDVVEARAGGRSPTYHVMLKPVARSRLAEVACLAASCVKRGLKTLVFADSHRMVELIRRVCVGMGVEMYVHRAGLLPEERRRIEEGLKRGGIMAVAATPTLELGIDIGDLDCVILANVPPTYSKYVQRTGRCGRRGRKAYVLMILGNDPISQYYENYPQDFFGKGFEPLAIELRNEEVAKVQLLAMALDSPVRVSELGEFERKVAEELVERGYLRLVKSRGYLRCTSKGARYLRSRPGLRGVGEVVRIYDLGGRLIGYREMPMALKELFPGAIYLHGGEVYVSLELAPPRAVVEKLPPALSLVTSPLYYSEPEEFRERSACTVAGMSVEYGDLRVKEAVYGYVVKDFASGAVLREAVLDREYSYVFKSKGLLIRLPLEPSWSLVDRAEAVHAVEHVLIAAAQTVVGAGLTDMGGVSFPTGHVFVYDSLPGGSGCSKLLFARLEEALKRAYRIVKSCSCVDGCPKCVYSPYCGNNNRVLSRRKALHLLEKVVSGKLEGLEVPEALQGKPLA